MKRISLILLFILLSNTLAIAGIGNLTATPKHNKIILNWVNPNMDVVVLVRKIDNYPETITDGICVYTGTGTAYIDSDVINGITYYYTIFDSAGNFSRVSATPQRDTSPPSAPGTITECFPDKDLDDTGKYVLYWTASKDDQSEVILYEVQERIGINGTWTTIGYTFLQKGTVSGRIAGNVYYYRVRAINEAELWSDWSDISDGIRVVDKAVELPATTTIRYGEMRVDVPANAFVGSVTFTISQILPPVNFASSNPKMHQFLSQCYELLAFESNTMKEVQPVEPFTMIFSYSPLNTAGTESDYRIYQFINELWQLPTEEQIVIPTEDVIVMRINRLSTYVIGYPEVKLPNVKNFTATAGNNRQMILEWEFPEDNRVTEVIIRRNTGTYATTPTEGTLVYRGSLTTHKEILLTPGTTYYYTAFTSDGGINYSSGVFAYAIATDTAPPGLVENFSVKGEFKKIVLSWSNPTDEDFLYVEIIRHLYHFPQTPKDGVSIYKGKGTSTVDEKVFSDQTYYYTAFTFDGINYSSATTAVQGSATTIKDNSPPSTIETITEGYMIDDIDRDVSKTGNYLICWSPGTDTESGITNYELQERKDLGSWKTIVDNTRLTYYPVFKRELGSIYHYRVRAKNGAGIYGSWSTASDGIRVVSDYFAPASIISFTKGAEKIEADVPGGAFEGTVTFTITHLPSLPVTNFDHASPKIRKSISSAWQLLAIDTNNEEKIPVETLTIFITYPDVGLSQNEEKKLRVYRLNEDNNRWERVSGEVIDTENNIIKIPITTLSIFLVALPSYPGDTLKEVKVYPNPFEPFKGHNKITFEGLKDNVTIRIYKITGELVYEKEYFATNGYEYWYGTNNHGEPLASGAYIYVIDGGGEKAIGKIAIIR